MVLACYVARASAQVRKPLGLIACGVWRLRRLGLPNASLSFRRGAQVAPSLRFLDLVNAFAMRCFAILVMLLAAISGAAEPREDLKPLGALCFVTCFAWREARMRARFCNGLLQPSIVSSTGAPWTVDSALLRLFLIVKLIRGAPMERIPPGSMGGNGVM